MVQIIDKYGNTSTDSANVIVIDKNGIVKKIDVGGATPTGPAGGDLSGTYPNPTVVWNNGSPTYDLLYYPIPTGTTSEYIRGDGSIVAFPTIFVLPSLTSGSVLFSNGTTIAQDNANLFWDDTNNRLGIGTNAPTTALDVRTSGQGYVTIGGADGVTISAYNNSGIASILNTGATSFNGFIYGSNFYDRSTNTQSVRLSSTTISLWTASTERLRVANNGNVLINTTTDAGYRLDVNGSARIQDNFSISSGFSIVSLGNNVNLRSYLLGGSGYVVNAQSYNTLNSSSNEQGFGVFTGIYAPTSVSGTPSFNALKLTPTINQTGGANGITRGLFINPTLTAAADFRAIENSVGKVCLNTTSGNTMIGTTTDVGFKLDVNGTARVQNTLTIKAPGALSTDLAFKIRNSADTLDLVTVNGLGTLIGKGFQGTYFYAGTTYYDNARIYIGSTSNAKFQTFTSGFSIEQGALTTIAPTAIFELKSTTQGFLPPRMTNAQRLAIATPAVGLCVYCTDAVEGLYINKSTGWTFIG